MKLPTYLISTIEMRVFCPEIECLKSATRLLNWVCVRWRGLHLSKEVLWVSVCLRAAKLPADKVAGLKRKLCHAAQRGWVGLKPGRMAEFLYKPPNLPANNSAALWHTETQSTSLERSKPCRSTQTVFKSLVAFFKTFYLQSKYPHFNSTY